MISALDVELTVKTAKSRALLERAKRVAPGGTQGDGRWSEPYPLFITRALGARLWDADGNEFIDYWGSAGPAVLGHNDPDVRSAVVAALEREGVLFTAPHPREVELAEVFTGLVPCAEKVVFCGGGASDAMYNAVRVARGYTGKSKILKFEGAYHGWHDDVAVSVRPSLAEAGPAEAPLPVAVSAGSLRTVVDLVAVAPFNDEDAVSRIVERDKDDLAAVIIEPVCHSAGCLVPRREFLEFIRDLTHAKGIVLIFDETITGFRHHIGGVQAMYEITPDLGVFGKGMANGYTISALAGRDDIMSRFTPLGDVFVSGTYMGNLIGVTAALATIDKLRDGGIHSKLWRLGKLIADGITGVIEEADVTARCDYFGGYWSVFFGEKLENYRDLIAADAYEKDDAYRRFLLNAGIYVQGGHKGSTRPVRGFISAAHDEEDIARTIEVTEAFFREYRGALT